MIDFHTHTPAWHSASWLAGKAFDADEFVTFLDGIGAESAVVLSHDGLFRATPEANDDLAAFVAKYPSRLFGFGTASPRNPGHRRRCAAVSPTWGCAG